MPGELDNRRRRLFDALAGCSFWALLLPRACGVSRLRSPPRRCAGSWRRPGLPSGPSGALVGTGGAHTGGVHDDACKEKGQAIRIVDGALVHDREDPWNPRGILGVIDGIEAVRWAWTLTGVATEKGAAEYAQWWTSRARQRPS